MERVQEALVLAMEKALSMGLKNVYFLSIDAAKLEEYFAPGEVDLIYLNFCDPWPRKKNAKRRLTFHTFLKSYQRVLRLSVGKSTSRRTTHRCSSGRSANLRPVGWRSAT